MGRAAIIINTKEARQKAFEWISKAPWGTRVEFKRSKRSLPQNDRMWAMLTDVAEQAEHHGQRYDTNTWKVIFMHALGREVQFVPALDGHGVVPIGQSSSDLSVDEMTELMDLIEAYAAENGIQLNDGREAP